MNSNASWDQTKQDGVKAGVCVSGRHQPLYVLHADFPPRSYRRLHLRHKLLQSVLRTAAIPGNEHKTRARQTVLQSSHHSPLSRSSVNAVCSFCLFPVPVPNKVSPEVKPTTRRTPRPLLGGSAGLRLPASEMAAVAVRSLSAAGGRRLLQLCGRRHAGLTRPAWCSSRTLWVTSPVRSEDQKSPPPFPDPAAEQSASPPRYTDQGGEESEGYESEEQLQQRILSAALTFVPEYGWSTEAIAEGAKSLDLSVAVAGMFENGGSELVLHFVSLCNKNLTELLEQENKLVQVGSAEKKPTAQFLRDAVEARLRMLIPYIGQWPQAMGILLLPHNIPSSLKLLTGMVDDIWHYASDQSTDVSWYTRRAVLAGIYNTTELVMMQDKSPDYEDTWNFLHNRISEAMTMGDSVTQVTATGEAVIQGLMGAAVTLKNLTGLNQRR